MVTKIVFKEGDPPKVIIQSGGYLFSSKEPRLAAGVGQGATVSDDLRGRAVVKTGLIDVKYIDERDGPKSGRSLGLPGVRFISYSRG